jgi:hypothetical protein
MAAVKKSRQARPQDDSFEIKDSAAWAICWLAPDDRTALC